MLTVNGDTFRGSNSAFFNLVNFPAVLELLFVLLVASTCYLVLKVVAKLTYLVANIDGHVTAQLPLIGRFMSKQNSIWSKA